MKESIAVALVVASRLAYVRAACDIGMPAPPVAPTSFQGMGLLEQMILNTSDDIPLDENGDNILLPEPMYLTNEEAARMPGKWVD